MLVYQRVMSICWREDPRGEAPQPGLIHNGGVCAIGEVPIATLSRVGASLIQERIGCRAQGRKTAEICLIGIYMVLYCLMCFLYGFICCYDSPVV